MDPDQTLANNRAIIVDLQRNPITAGEVFDLADELAEMGEDLDKWLTKGGFAPAAWRIAQVDDLLRQQGYPSIHTDNHP